MLDCGSTRKTKMVERPPCCLEQESNFTEPSSVDNQDRCFHNGMGSMLWKFSDQRPLVSVRKVTTHKLSRTSSGWVCPEILSKKQVQYPCKTNDGQYNSNKLYIKQNGWPTSLVLSSLTFDLWQWCLEWSITVKAHHLPGRLHIVADFESWAHPDTSDWQLDPSIFQGINNKRGPFTIDLFASRLTALLHRFVSWKPDPEAEAEDAFTLDWSQLREYAFPPFALTGWCLRQVLQQSVSQLTIVAPVWETQPWYQLLLEMMVDHPILLPSFPGLLRQENELHPLVNLKLAAWLVSGVNMKVQQFHS